jgi:hypothetical protein
MTSLKRNSTKKPLFKLNPLFENYFKVCSEDLPYKNIYKANSMFPQEFTNMKNELQNEEN